MFTTFCIYLTNSNISEAHFCTREPDDWRYWSAFSVCSGRICWDCISGPGPWTWSRLGRIWRGPGSGEWPPQCAAPGWGPGCTRARGWPRWGWGPQTPDRAPSPPPRDTGQSDAPRPLDTSGADSSAPHLPRPFEQQILELREKNIIITRSGIWNCWVTLTLSASLTCGAGPPSVDLVARVVTWPPDMGGLGQTPALSPAWWADQQLLPRGAVTLLGRGQTDHTHGPAVTPRHIAELHLTQPGHLGVTRTRAGLTRDPGVTCHQPLVPGTRSSTQEAVALAVWRPEYLERESWFYNSQ